MKITIIYGPRIEKVWKRCQEWLKAWQGTDRPKEIDDPSKDHHYPFLR